MSDLVLAVSVAGLVGRVARVVEVFESDDGELWRALERIVDSPHRSLERARPRVSPAEAQAVRADSLLDSVLTPGGIGLTGRRPHFVSGDGRRWRFLSVLDERNVLSFDTVPNRFVAHVLHTVAAELRRTARLLARVPVAARDAEVAQALDDADDLQRRLRALVGGAPALAGASRLELVPLDNLVLRHDPRYRRVLQSWLELV